MRMMAILAAAAMAFPAVAEEAPASEERLWTCETSIAGEKTEINYFRDAEFRLSLIHI